LILRSICGQRIHIGSREKPELGSFRVLSQRRKIIGGKIQCINF
jgi:hypothetical protein